MHAKVRTCLAFRDQAEEAARFYVSLLPGSELETVFRPNPGEPALTALFTLAGTPYQALNMGDYVTLNDAVSISVMTKDQEETDRLWAALLADGGAENRCGWLKDRFGLSWQIVPEVLPRLLTAEDRAAAGRAMQAMLGMVKLDIAGLEAAFKG
ncbi:VOC family protein [Methylocystis sp. IM3]|jgi:predicted 3-demethylubiquinone-9 3-methyltransferase (glyoxalase superfamily)|uniref:VOC family protein n=1 Tax=unclassified Methylocystis TaxID=2625913 RepID=UPI0030FA572F